MKHRVGFNRLSRKASHRKAMLRNMVTSLFEYERITTTKAKALEVRRIAEKMITRAKADSVHSRRIIAKRIWDKAIVNKLFTEIGPRYKERNGGYCRILKIGFRKGDAADMVILELVDRDGTEEPKKEAKAEKKAPKAKKSEPKAKAAPKKESKPAKAEAAAEESAVEEKAEEPVEAKE